MNQRARQVLAIYAILLILLGAIGYYEAHSIASLISGLVTGIILLIGSFSNSKIVGCGALLILAGLTGLFIYRYLITAQITPALLALLSGGVFIFLSLRFAAWRR